MINMDDDYIDIYCELDEPDITEQFQKLRQENIKLTTHVNVLEEENKRLTAEIAKLKLSLEALTKNISELFNTAKNESQRKDRMINNLRSQLELAKRQNTAYQLGNRQKYPIVKPKCEISEEINNPGFNVQDGTMQNAQLKDKNSVCLQVKEEKPFNLHLDRNKSKSNSRERNLPDYYCRERLDEYKDGHNVNNRNGKLGSESRIHNERNRDRSRDVSEKDINLLDGNSKKSHSRSRYRRDCSKDYRSKSKERFSTHSKDHRYNRRRNRDRSNEERHRHRSKERSSREVIKENIKRERGVDDNNGKHDTEMRVTSVKSSSEERLAPRKREFEDVCNQKSQDQCKANGIIGEGRQYTEQKILNSRQQETISNVKQNDGKNYKNVVEAVATYTRARTIDEHRKQSTVKLNKEEAFKKLQEARNHKKHEIPDSWDGYKIPHTSDISNKEQNACTIVASEHYYENKILGLTIDPRKNAEVKKHLKENSCFTIYPELHIIEMDNAEVAPKCPELLMDKYLLAKDETELLRIKSDIMMSLYPDTESNQSSRKKRWLQESDDRTTNKKPKEDFNWQKELSNSSEDSILESSRSLAGTEKGLLSGEDVNKIDGTKEDGIELKNSKQINFEESCPECKMDEYTTNNAVVNDIIKNVENVRQSSSIDKENLHESHSTDRSNISKAETNRKGNQCNNVKSNTNDEDVDGNITDALRVLDGNDAITKKESDLCQTQIESTIDLVNCLKTPPCNKNLGNVDETDIQIFDCRPSTSSELIQNCSQSTNNTQNSLRSAINSLQNVSNLSQNTIDSSQNSINCTQNSMNLLQNPMNLSSNAMNLQDVMNCSQNVMNYSQNMTLQNTINSSHSTSNSSLSTSSSDSTTTTTSSSASISSQLNENLSNCSDVMDFSQSGPNGDKRVNKSDLELSQDASIKDSIVSSNENSTMSPMKGRRRRCTVRLNK